MEIAYSAAKKSLDILDAFNFVLFASSSAASFSSEFLI